MSEFPVKSGSLPSLLDGMKQANITGSTSFGLATGASYSVSALLCRFKLVSRLTYEHRVESW
jgi:hypothetical protein